MEIEIWKDVSGWTFYQVSNLGRVRSKDRTNYRSNGRIDNRKGKILSPGSSKRDGYLRVSFWDKQTNTRKTHPVHVLVANAFCGKLKECVHHINAIRHDNRAVNLQHATNRENVMERWKRTKSSLTGAKLCKGKQVRPWRSSTNYNGKYYCLGYYDTQEEAAAAYHAVHKFIKMNERTNK